MKKKIIEVRCGCPFCGEVNSVFVEKEDYEAYENGAKAQDVFPYLSADERELLISGICAKCWDF